MIVDASVALQWLVQEDGSDAALALLDEGPLTAPDLIFPEVANGLWKKVQRGELQRLPDTLGRLGSILDRIEPTAPCLERATAIAVELRHSAYDCFYLALAEVMDDVVVTSDRKLLRRCADTAFAARLRTLGATA
ncbi:type II toxin-antitoxin system VapC family toxin [Sandaracinobacteroides saxicola]|uniref:Ribonuclease VapC n=1 Tax=Sandaracinobacteroides saxicola TaxID=2759707 RepID=A0A7G5IL25_9SPHN|nr:type II toxin-antitoxin system VapC family toxin [Sandaracinobacteroides saxicola]QMW24067.1 type II toxin-antitoxin system VapC family toxin [Sandaracinobacteroides saxicola]